MGILLKTIGIGLAANGLKKIKNYMDHVEEENRRKVENEKRRKNSVCTFDGEISEVEFRAMVKRAIRGIKRINILCVEGPIINGTVRSCSGLSDWNFQIDFNDYGNLTGKYWIVSQNHDSEIPSVIAERIVKQIQNYSDCVDDFSNQEQNREKNQNNSYTRIVGYCPYCGKPNTDKDATECDYCGWRFRI